MSNEVLMTNQSSRMKLTLMIKTTCIPEHLNDDVGEGVLVVLHPVCLLARLHLLVTEKKEKILHIYVHQHFQSFRL
jgi:hypothetical protein